MAVVLALTGRFGLRTGEGLCLRRADFHLENEAPKLCVGGGEVGNKKSPGDVYIRQKDMQYVKDMLAGRVMYTKTGWRS